MFTMDVMKKLHEKSQSGIAMASVDKVTYEANIILDAMGTRGVDRVAVMAVITALVCFDAGVSLHDAAQEAWYETENSELE